MDCRFNFSTRVSTHGFPNCQSTRLHDLGWSSDILIGGRTSSRTFDAHPCREPIKTRDEQLNALGAETGELLSSAWACVVPLVNCS